ncbi:hypothetical protein PR003_g29474 [Phytophthora rubi]|uniref:CCHC-type domain-containing protein n=1 Tax=Phytophthora rubi TaxID=129364 RepID=A0A6A4BMN6_9STRA|nr:hypothetical protein PR003_g29474 [Phytophthora rubi]
MPQKRPSTLVPSWDPSKETTVPRQKTKAPDLEDDEEKGSEPRWSEAALEFAYNRQELQKFIDQDPVLRILRPRQIGTPKGPVAAPTASENKLDLVKGLLSLLKEKGLVASPFDADELFDLDVEVIRSSARGLFESPLEYLYRLNVAALRAKLKIKDGDSKTRREHVEHFIETLGDPDLADRLTLLRLNDVDDLEEVLRARDRAKGRQKRSAFGSKYRQKASTPASAAPAKRSVHAVPRSAPESGSDTGSDGSDSEGDLRRIYLASAEDKEHEAKDEAQSVEPARRGKINPDSPRPRSQQDGADRNVRCSHCGSRKHTDLGCWRRLTCEKCGKRGHPAEHCLFVCRGCGELHDMGKCPMEEFYNQIRQWYNPAKHAGMLPAPVEKMLN